ncbi:MAG: hypothetical protein ACLSDQ_04015 [Adlercreutzia equolifaciens]
MTVRHSRDEDGGGRPQRPGNIVLIGKLCRDRLCSEEALDGAIAKVAGKKPEKLEQNRQAIKLGINA